MPGRSLATTGTPAAIASKSLFGVVRRWLSVVGWIGIATTSAEATQSSSSVGRHGRQDPQSPAHRRIRRPGRELRQQRPIAEEHEHGPIDRRDGLDQLLDPAVPRETALVQDDADLRRQAQRVVEPARLRHGRVEPVRAVQHDQGQLDAEAGRHDLRVRAIDRDDPRRPPGPASLAAADDGPRRPRQPGEIAGIEVDVPGVVHGPAAVPAREVEGNGDAHVGHAVVEIRALAQPAGRLRLRSNDEDDRRHALDGAGQSGEAAEQARTRWRPDVVGFALGIGGAGARVEGTAEAEGTDEAEAGARVEGVAVAAERADRSRRRLRHELAARITGSGSGRPEPAETLTRRIR